MAQSLVKNAWKHVLRLQSLIWIILSFTLPLLLFTFLEFEIAKWRMLYVMLVMIISWLSSCIDISIVSLYPIILFPLLGIMSSADVSSKYMKPSIILYIGSCIIGCAITSCSLDKRIALVIIKLSGPCEHKLLAGMMLCTAFLSMWISNTATTVMLLPIVAMIVTIVNQESVIPPPSPISIPSDHSKSIVSTGENLFKDENSRDCTSVNSQMNLLGKSMGSCVEAVSQNDRAYIDSSNSAPATTQLSPDSDEYLSTEELNKNIQKRKSNFRIMMYLSVAYSSSIGGIATLTGTPTNTVLIGLIFERYVNSDSPVSFAKWMLWATPLSLLILIATWIILQFVWMGYRNTIDNLMPENFYNKTVKVFKSIVSCLLCRGRNSIRSSQVHLNNLPYSMGNSLGNDGNVIEMKNIIEKKNKKTNLHSEIDQKINDTYLALGDWKYSEKIVMTIFVLLMLLLSTRSPEIFPGWEILFLPKYVDDSIVAIALCMLCFFLPSHNIFAPIPVENVPNEETRGRRDMEANTLIQPRVYPPYTPIITWKYAATKIDWGVCLILGSGYALAAGIKTSSLDTWISLQLEKLNTLPLNSIVLIVILFTGALTQITTNISTANIILPIIMSVSDAMKINPLLLSVSATASASFAYMLPISSICNSLVFKAGDMKPWDMIKTGAMVGIVSSLILYLAVLTWGYPIFDLGNYPTWA